MQRYLRYSLFLLILFASSAAFCEVRLHMTVTFGDSLTHNDLLWVRSGIPRDVYGDDAMEAVFNKGSKTGDDLKSYAIAGAESDQLEAQITIYLDEVTAGQEREATLISLEIGGNDIMTHISSLAAHPPGENYSTDKKIDDLISNIRNCCRRLRNMQRDAKIIVWTIPDITTTPELYSELTPRQAANVRAHIRRANRAIKKLGGFRRTVVFDLYRLIQNNVNNPPVINGQELVPPPAYGDYDHLFADSFHPSAVSNALIANSIIRRINKKWNDDIPTYRRRELARLAGLN